MIKIYDQKSMKRLLHGYHFYYNLGDLGGVHMRLPEGGMFFNGIGRRELMYALVICYDIL